MFETAYYSQLMDKDREDQAVGRIMRLLPMLSVKELDALADRLSQKLADHEIPNQASLSPIGCHDQNITPEQAMTEAELRIDMVGQ